MISLYNGKYTMEFNPTSHRYKVDGKPKQGVTSTLGVLSKAQLIQWAANMATDTFRESFHLMASISEPEFKELCKKAKYAHRNYKDQKAEIGSRVHYWITEHIQGHDTDIDDAMRPSVEAFLEWERAVDADFLFSERPLYSEQHDYCGTVDIGCTIGGKRFVIDLKTGKPDEEWNDRKKGYTGRLRARSEHFIQDAAYEQCLSEEDKINSDMLSVIYLPLDGSIHVFDSPEVSFWKEVWLSVLSTDRLLKRANKQVNQYRGVT